MDYFFLSFVGDIFSGKKGNKKISFLLTITFNWSFRSDLQQEEFTIYFYVETFTNHSFLYAWNISSYSANPVHFILRFTVIDSLYAICFAVNVYSAEPF